MIQTNLSQAIPVNIPATLQLTVTHEQLVELAIANWAIALARRVCSQITSSPILKRVNVACQRELIAINRQPQVQDKFSNNSLADKIGKIAPAKS